MNAVLADISEAARKLSREERADLALILIESLDPGADGDVNVAWRDVALKRARELDEGVSRTIPAEEVFAGLRRTLG